MERNAESCPYCGQVNLSGEDPRMLCGCFKAVKYRRICGALWKQSEDAAPMREIDERVMDVLKEAADLICLDLVDGLTVSLSDGTKVQIGGKVSRSARLKVEEKVTG